MRGVLHTGHICAQEKGLLTVEAMNYNLHELPKSFGGMSGGGLWRRGIFSTLMEKLKTKRVPLRASLLHGNLSSMVDILVNSGFTKIEPMLHAKETKLVWSPQAKQNTVST
jgi:hypothetical protein